MALKDILEANSKGLFYDLTDKEYGVNNYVSSGIVISGRYGEENPGTFKLYSGPCHASMRNYASEDTYCYTSINRAFAKNKGAIKYFDWLVNRSAFRDAFVTKDPEDCAKNGTILSCNYHGDGWLSAAQLARFGTSEYKDHFKGVCAVIEDGYNIHPMLLTLIAVSYRLVLAKGQYTATTPYEFANYNSHMPFSGQNTTKLLKAFCADEKLVAKKDTEFWRTKTWVNSHKVLTTDDRVKKASAYNYVDNNVIAATYLMSKEPFTVGAKVKQVEEKLVEVLWHKAVKLFEKQLAEKAGAAALGGGAYLNLGLLEQMTETLKLGELE